MNKYLGYTLSLTIVFLQGCGPIQPKISPEELAKKRLSTLNVYDDNRVAVKTSNSVNYQRGNGFAWNENKDVAFVYSTGTEYYNAKDLTSIIKDNSSGNMALFLKDGSKKYFTKNTFELLRCNKEKNCYLDYNHYMKAIRESDLNSTPSGRSNHVILNDFRADPNMSGEDYKIEILDDIGYADLAEKVYGMQDRIGSANAKIAEKNAKEWENVKKLETESRQQANKTGQVNCDSTDTTCATSSYLDRTRLSCGNFTSSVSEMKKNGWVIANVSSEVLHSTISGMCPYKIYHFHYKK